MYLIKGWTVSNGLLKNAVITKKEIQDKHNRLIFFKAIRMKCCFK